LNVVIESEHLIAVTIENRTRVDAGKVFPLEECRRKDFLDGGYKRVDEALVIDTGDARVAPTEVFRIAKALLVVRADVEDDGKGARGMDSADEAVERKLADGDAQSADALIADAKNALAVGNHDDVDFWIWMIAQKRRNGVTQGIRDEKAARTAIDVAELLATERDDRRVDDRQHLLDMVEEEPVKEHFVGVLKLAKIDVAFEVVGLKAKRLISADALIFERFNYGGKQAVKAKDFTLLLRESGALVERRIV
jgi:hypothetical protein